MSQTCTSRPSAVSLEAGFSFQCSSNSGAFVRLATPGVTRSLESRGHVKKYIRENFKEWLRFANSCDHYGLGLDLHDHELLFVFSTTKTTHWVVAAFHAGGYRKKQGYLSGGFGPLAATTLSLTISDQVLPGSYYRTGPTSFRPVSPFSPPSVDSAKTEGMPEGVGPGTEPALAALAELPNLGVESITSASAAGAARNQCLFIHFYKMKRRPPWLFKEPIRAAAGPHQLPPGSKDPGASFAVTSDSREVISQYEEAPARSQVRYNP